MTTRPQVDISTLNPSLRCMIGASSPLTMHRAATVELPRAGGVQARSSGRTRVRPGEVPPGRVEPEGEGIPGPLASADRSEPGAGENSHRQGCSAYVSQRLDAETIEVSKRPEGRDPKPSLRGTGNPLPSRHQVLLDVEEIENPAHGVIYEVSYGLGPGIEGGHGDIDDSTHV